MSKTVDAIVDFSQAQADTLSFSPDAEKVLSGNPAQTVTNLYDDESGAFSAGFWTGEPGIYKVSYTEEEFCHLLSGVVKITDASGRSKQFKAGTALSSPPGLKAVGRRSNPHVKSMLSTKSRNRMAGGGEARLCRPYPSDRNDLARVHDIIRVEGFFQRPHQADRLAVFGCQIGHFADADTMFPGTGAAKGDGAMI